MARKVADWRRSRTGSSPANARRLEEHLPGRGYEWTVAKSADAQPMGG
jgi:hypothetical protein